MAEIKRQRRNTRFVLLGPPTEQENLRKIREVGVLVYFILCTPHLHARAFVSDGVNVATLITLPAAVLMSPFRIGLWQQFADTPSKYL